jgi:hypothetical protein
VVKEVRFVEMKKTWLKDLPDTHDCPRCDSVMTKDDQTYSCVECGLQVWADPIGCGLVRYVILPSAAGSVPTP